MPAELQCPKCHLVNVIFSKKRNLYVCEDCGSEFVVDKPFIARRIFISYGHDEHVSLAIRLRDDLKQRGHSVWFDAEHLHAGLDWESSIEQALKELVADPANSAVILLLTPHSVRRPNGYCLNEVAYAQTKGLRIIPVMVVETEPPLSICRVQWLDMRECIPIHAKEALYLPHYERLLKALEEDQIDFEGTQSRLIRTLNPIQFSADIVKLLKDFTGRKWVFSEVDAWLNNPAGSKIFWITGAPGVGKSAISAWIRDHRREVAAFHFCDSNSEEKRNPGKMVCSLVYQLSTQLPEYQDRLARLPLETIVQEYHEAYTLFDKLLIQPLAANYPSPDRTIVVLIDALDEANYQRQNEIVRFLSMCADKTPPWLRFLVTSRPEPEIVSAFQTLSPYVLDTARPENLRDLGDYLSARLSEITPEQKQVILDRSEGVFLYVRYVVDSVLGGQLSFQHLDDFPRGLGDVYQQYFQRQFGSELAFFEQKIAPLLQPVLAAYEPLTLGYLKRHCGIEDDTGLFRLLNCLGSLFPASGQTETATLRPFHRSISDWICDRSKAGIYVIAASDGHRVLAERGWQQFEQGPEKMDDYFLQWLPAHLLALRDDQRLVRLLKDFRYLIEKTRRGMTERLQTDFRELPSRMTSNRAELETEAAFFLEKAHILRRGNEEWPAHKILLQLAIEHADDSPLTVGAERWLTDNRCDWFWFRRVPRLPHVQESACLATFEGHTYGVWGALALADGRLLSWSSDKTLRLWDSHSGACLTTLQGHTDGVWGALALADGRLLSWSADKTLRIWESHSGMCLAILEGHTSRIAGALLLADGRVLSWSPDKTLRIWDSHSGACLTTLEGHADEIAGALLLADGRVLSWSPDKTLRIWDSHSGACLIILNGHIKAITGALLLADGRVLSWSPDTTLRIWDSHSGACLATLEGHIYGVWGALALANGQLLSWSSDKTLRLWDCHGGACLAILKGHTDDIRGALVLDDEYLLSWSTDATMKLWNYRTGSCLTTFEGQVYRVTGVLALADGRLLSWSPDKILRLWDCHSGACLAILSGHTNRVSGVLALADGRLLSWSTDKTLRLWNSQGGKCRTILEGHTHRVKGGLEIAVGRFLTWSSDKSLRLWNSYSGECVEVCTEAQAVELHPDWILAQAKTRKDETIGEEFIAESVARTAHLRHRFTQCILAVWNTDSDSDTWCLMTDGTIVLTQPNGQVCFLKLYHGNNRTSLAEAEECIPQSNKKTSGASNLSMELPLPSKKHDVFICCKIDDRTYSLQVYDFLTAKGVSCYWSEYSFPLLGVSEYRKENDKALDECIHMVVVSSSRTNITSPWVESEWGFFLNEKRAGFKRGNICTVLAGGLKREDLPASLRDYELIPLSIEGLEKLLKLLTTPDRDPP